MIGVIARKECRELFRDGRLRVSAAVLWLLLLAGGLLGWSHYLDVTDQVRRASANERQRWLDQGEKHPHSAAHYGVFAFKTPRSLSIIDSGVEPYVGSTLWLEAHKQNETLYRPAEDATALQRFGDLSIAAVLRMLAPLLVIVVGFAAFSGEREAGTLRQLLSLGAGPRDLLLGKALGLAAALFVVLVPALCLGFVAVVLGPEGLVRDELARGGLMVLLYGFYLGGFLFLTLAVSAWSRSSRTALVVLFVFWAMSVLILPRAVSDEAKALYPTEAAVALKHELETNLADAHAPAGLSARTAALLEKYKVDKVADLPLDLSGVSIQDGEERNHPVFERHYGAFLEILRAQDRLYQLATLLAPATGVQLVSMALAGTDLGHHHDFVDQAESTRRIIQAKINEGILATSEKTAEGRWRARAGRELWETIPGFAYEPPAWQKAVAPYGLALGLLALWLALTFGAAILAVSRLRAV
jgi:ABC-2 type transport system permease protein